ncbi:MAG: hypothetical protein ACOY5C_07445 [Pseudomonadota bacterium]|uniref:hypothetical protein n=1 Tax=Thermithiobacillus tepidarius TaxID=929 RepID=UPI0006861DF0|nr:hypothetical protein [Thermithiobacillus tepidarius]
MVREDCRRPPVWAERPGRVASWIYNKAHLLLARQEAPVYVPLRYISLMAILDPHEWVFCDYIGGRVAVTVWHHFDPHVRQSLEEPVPCRMDLFGPEGEAVLKRLPMEFARGLDAALAKLPHAGEAAVVPLKRSHEPSDPS